jgi:hypothetical protein
MRRSHGIKESRFPAAVLVTNHKVAAAKQLSA